MEIGRIKAESQTFRWNVMDIIKEIRKDFQIASTCIIPNTSVDSFQEAPFMGNR